MEFAAILSAYKHKFTIKADWQLEKSDKLCYFSIMYACVMIDHREKSNYYHPITITETDDLAVQNVAYLTLAAIIGASQHLTRAKVRFLVEMFAKTMSILLEKRELLILQVFFIHRGHILIAPIPR